MSAPIRPRRNLARRPNGAVAVELAIIMTVTFFIIPVILMLGRVFWYYGTIRQASHDAARFMGAMPAAELLVAARLQDAETLAKQLVVRSLGKAGIAESEILAVEIQCIDQSFGGATCGTFTVPGSPKPRAVWVRVWVNLDVNFYGEITQEYLPNEISFRFYSEATVPYIH
jgi:Flp pilus assembly protein TadG